MKFQFDLLPPLRTLHASCSAFAHYMATTPSAIVAFLSKPTNALNAQDKEAVLIELSTLLVTEEELTLPIARLFRPLLSEFVGRVVYEGTAMTRAGASTELFPAESVASAFSKILPLAPHLCSTILEYFARVPSLFERIERTTDVSKVPISVWIRLAQTAYRLLRFSVAEFGSSLWDWSPFFALLSLEDKTLRHYTLRCVALLLQVSDSSKWKLPLNTDKEQIKILQEQCIKEGAEEALEQMALLVGNAEKPEQTSSNTTIVEAKDLHTPLVDVCGILLSKKPNISNNTTLITSEETANANETTNHKENRLVYTPTAAQNMRALALAVCQGQPILLEGVTGAGKTALIEELATLALHHPRDLIRIHLGDQTDAKVLLGTYVCTDVPGEFRWQAGALTQAVREGRWIVIEDIDMAPLEILSVLIPLLETRQLFIPGRGEVVCAPKSFQLFATQTLLPGNASSSSQNARLLGNFWTRVIVDPLTSEELSEVLRIKYPEIASLVPQFMETYLALTRTASSNKQEPVDTPQTPKTQYLLPSVFAGRYLSTRDLLKWCKRVHRLFKHSAHENMTTLQVREAIFSEAMDCFAALIPSPKWRRQCCTILGSCWGLTPERSHHYLDMYKPSTTRSPSAFCVGRVTLPKIQLQAKIGLGEQQTRNFAHTKHSLTLLEKIAMSVYMEEPVLLVGETGTGKTSVVQYLANMLNRPLTIQNMSQQSDTADLLGGFKPVELRIVCAPLKQQFEKLFTKTFSRKANKKFINDVELSYAKKNWPRFVRLLNQAIRMAAQKLEQRQKAGTNKHPVEEQQDSNQQRSTQRKRKTRSNSNASSNASSSSSASKDGSWSPQLREEWKQFAAAISKFELQQEQVKNNFAFSFVEGSLVNAIRNGHWLLLDEINLATAETLESISSLLDGGSVCLTERGDVEPIPRHSDLRIFACMNPPTDIGKKNLVPALRNRFTEIYVDELSSAEDLRIVVSSYLSEAMTKPPIDEIVSFYLAARSAARVELADGANQKPHYSLRTLCRALEYAKLILPMGYGPKRALYEGFRMSFLTQLNEASYPLMAKLIDQHFLQGMSPKELKRPPRRPSSSATKSKNNEEDVDDYDDEGKETVTSSHVLFEQFWIAVGDQPPINPASYILTPTIRQHITNLARIVLAGKYPVLLQGPTSSGKTSMVEYLARRTGHRFVRINNHEHTDIQEYLGTYVSDPQTGKLVFREGILVEAVRKGYWVVLDELNLAPSEVLEALNRLLDDNHELFIPETQEIVRPHPHFMLFATQNPPGIYGGRKVLSRAFRNRFLELHIDDIPSEELETILNQRCQLPPSYCKKLVLVMQDLQRHRQGTRVFAGKHGFITLRDLFRWAERRPGSWQELAEEGYMLLAERLRRDEEKQVIQYCLEKHMPRVSLDLNAIYNRGFARPPQEQASSHDAPNPEEEDNTSYGSVTIEELKTLEGFEHIVWTKSMRRLFTLVGRCLQHKEPVLLVGETGSGKTSICQLYAALLKQRLHILNCHQQTETADFLGGLRPVRGKEAIRTKCKALVAQCFAALAEFFASSAALLPPSNSELLEIVKGQLQKEGEQSLEANPLAEQMEIVNRCALMLSHLEKKIAITNDEGSKTAIKKKDGKRKQEVIPYEKEEKEQENDEADQALLELSPSQVALLQQQLNALRQLVQEIQALHKQHTALFQWYDGPLVQAMKRGDLFLIDEISLAEDSVLERLNSVLEPHRLLVLAEKGGGGDNDIEELTAHSEFRILATMNPGGDFGKKELSPAMRNRFTEIWVPAITEREDLTFIIKERFIPPLVTYHVPLLDFMEWFRPLATKRSLSLRDVLAWISFMNTTTKEPEEEGERRKRRGCGLTAAEAYIHGACMVLLDALDSSTPRSLLLSTSSSSSSSSATSASQPTQVSKLKRRCLEMLLSQLSKEEIAGLDVDGLLATGMLLTKSQDKEAKEVERMDHDGDAQPRTFGLPNCPFKIDMGIPDEGNTSLDFALLAPTTSKNCMRVLRALQLPKPILLEGSPGVGKTSLVTAIAKASGHHPLVRINLSEQTDMMDLLGSDLPVQGGGGGEFAWCDGVLLKALKRGDWVLLDELNLASQSVLEGLNSILDHRAEMYLPELGRSFHCPPTFRIFACQNPVRQGGGRKGLPKSFLNRFTQVHVDELHSEDLLFITQSLYPHIPSSILQKMIHFNELLFRETMVENKYARKGSPWEFNLRDVFRWCDVMTLRQKPATTTTELNNSSSLCWDPAQHLDLIYLQRMRTPEDKEHVLRLFNRVFSSSPATSQMQRTMDEPSSAFFTPEKHPYYNITPDYIQVGSSCLPRRCSKQLQTGGESIGYHLLKGSLNVLENMMTIVEKRWMTILIGPPASGKTSTVRLLSELTGNPLKEFCMNSSVDTTELLGGFEQIDLQRHKREVLQQLGDLLQRVSEELLLRYFFVKTAGGEGKEQQLYLSTLQDLHSTWSVLTARTRFSASPSSSSPSTPSSSASSESLMLHRATSNYDEEQYHLFDQLCVKLQTSIERFCLFTSSQQQEETDSSSSASIPTIKQQLRNLRQAEQRSVSGCFEWVDGMLIKALENGHWILIDNVNFCPSTVLDRLNPLLENEGVLLVNERGLVDGEIKRIVPHPNFRLFLAMDPQNGEISRAMRNRGIELSLLPPDLSYGSASSSYEEDDKKVVNDDAIVLLNGRGIPGSRFPQRMIAFHQTLISAYEGFGVISSSSSTNQHHCLTLRALLQWASLTVEQCRRGVALAESLLNAMELVYVRHLRQHAHQQSVRALYHQHFDAFLQPFSASSYADVAQALNLASDLYDLFAGRPQQQHQMQTLSTLFLAPTLWPFFVSGPSYQQDSILTSVQRQGALLQHQLFKGQGTGYDVPRLLEIASLYLLENVSAEDWAHRIHWMNASCAQYKTSFPASSDFIAALPSVLEQAEQHPLVVMCQRVRTTLQQQLREVHKRSNSNNMSVSFDRLLTFQPIDLEPNAPLVNRLSNTVFFSRDGNEEEEEEEEQRNVLLWRFYENLMQRVPLLLVLLFQQHKERYLLRSLLNQKPSSSSSSHLDNLDVISLSYLFFHQKISATRLPHPSISLLPSFFAELDTILQERMINQEESGVDIAAMEVVLRERLEFWNYLQGIRRAGDFELASYHLRWIALAKCLQKRFPSSSSSSSLSTLVTRMSELLETSLGSGSQEEDEERRTKEDPREKAKRTLWRHGPKASLLRSEDMFSLERQLLVALYSFIDNKTMHNLPSSSSLTQEEEKENSSNNKLDLSVVSCRLFSAEESSHPLLGYLDEEFKRLLVEGLATLYWLDGSKDKNDINDNNLKTLATIRGRQSERQPLMRSLQELTSLLFQRMKVFQKRYLAFNAPIMEEVLLENEKSLLSSSLSEQQLHQQVMLLSSSAMTMGRENLAENLWPLSDHVSLREERSVIARVLRLCSLLNRSSCGENDHQLLLELRKEARKVLHLVRAFFEKGLKHTSRPPDDFLPYQQLVWKLEGALEEEEEKNDDNIENKQKTEKTKQKQVIEPALLVHRLKSLQISTLAQEMNLRHNLRLWNNSFNDLSFLKPHHHRNREEDEQMHGVLGAEGKGPSRLFQSVQSLFVFHMFGDWRSSLTIGDHNQRTVQLKRLAAHFCESSLADPRSSDWLSLFYCISQVIDCFKHCFIAEQWNFIVNHLATLEAALISSLCDEPITNNTLSQQQGETLHKLLLSCNNQSFEQRVESLLLPCFRLLFWKLSQHQQEKSEENNNVPEQVMELMAQSQLNIFLGLLRMELLLPMQRIDPTAKYAVRLQQLEARCTALDDEVKQREELEQLFTGKSTNARIEHLLREKQVCLAQMKALKELLVLRPSSSSTSFSALYEDLHRFAQMQGKQSVVLDLMNSFLSALRSVYASLPNTLNDSILHQREQLWQEKAVHFVVHIANEYPYYKDITEPFSVAVQQMMFGLRILRFELGSLIHQNNQHQQKQIKRSRRTAEEEEEEEKERAVSQGLLVGYYSRRGEKQQQQSVNRLEHLLAQRASGALLRNSLWKLLLHLVSFPFKENVSSSSSPSIFPSPLQHIERGLMDADSLYLLRHDDRQNVFRDLYPQVLRNVMSRLFLHINNTSSSSMLVPKKKTLSKISFFMLDFVFSEFVAIWERAKQRARKRQEEEAEFFKRKQRETLILTEEEEEEKSLRELFPDYWDIFADLGVTGGDTKDGDDVELDKEARKAEQEEKELRERIEKVRLEEEKRTVADLKDWEVHHICDTHAHIFQFSSSPLSSLVFHQPNKDNKKKNRRRRRKQQRIKEEESEEEQRDRLYEKAHTDLLQTCYQVGLRMLERLDFNVPPELDEQGVGAHLLLMRTLHKALSLPPAAEMKKRQFWLSSSSPTPSSSANKEANNEGEVVSFIDTPAGKQGLDYDIYRDSNVPEVLLIQAPLEALLKRLQELLEEFPGNALLEQLIKIVRRIMAFPITSPLMKVLTGLELLHGKAYDWETNASKTVSLQQELQQLARLIGRWRRLELQSWPMLLRARTQVHQMKGEKWWFYLYSLLLDFGSEDSAFDFCTGASKDEKQKQKEEEKKRKRRRGGAKEEEEANEVEEKAEEKEDIVAVLDRFLRLSTYGEFVTRLNMMVNFYHHLETELSITSQQDCEEKGQKHVKWEKRSRLSNVFYNIQRYYAQFIDSLASGLQTMREPIEKKMKDFVKLARWDDLSHYALKLAAEKSHRKLNKFTRKMEEVLTASIIPVLEEKSLSIDDIETVRTKRREQRERQKKKEQRRAQRQQLKHKKKDGKAQEKEEEGKEKEEEDEEDTIAFWEYAPDSLRWHSDTFIFNTSPSSFISHERGQRTPELTAIFDLENKGNKLQQLFSRLQKICSRHLFLLPRRRIEDKDEELLAMHHPTTRREQELIELEALCTDLVERTLFLRDQSKAKTKKIHSFRDMLHSLHQVRGLSHLSTAYSPRQKDMNHVLSLPSLHNVDSFFASSSLSQQQNEDESAKWTQEHVPSLWKASNELYYKLLRRMQNMRQAMEVPSKELNAKEIARSSGYCEHLFHLVLLQRERIERMTTDHADLSMLLSTFASLHRHHQQQQQTDCCLPAQEEAQRWLLLQKNVLDQLEQMLRQLALVIKAIPASSSSFNTDALCRLLKEQADICARCKHRLQLQFDGWKFDVFVALADRLQQQQNEEADSSEYFFDERILVTGECWGVVSQNFASLDALVSSLRQHLKKATDDEEESKRSQLTLPEPVREDALSLLCKVRQLVDAFVEQQRREEVVLEREKEGEPPEIMFGKSFSEKASLLVDNILISIQNAKQIQEKMEASSSAEAKEEGIQHFERANLPELNTYFEQLYHSLRPSKLNAQALELLYELARFNRQQQSGTINQMTVELIAHIFPLLCQYQAVMRWWTVRFMTLHHSLCRTLYVLSAMVLTLFTEGYCCPPSSEEGEGEGGEGQMKFEDDVAGTGMGDAQGKKDVSEQIEDEEQLMGTTNEEKEERRDEDKEDEERNEEEGFDMQQDFDGELENVDEKDEEKEENEEQEEEEEELEREMGELDEDEENVVDEKLWNPSDDEEDEDENQKEEKIEKDSSVDSQGQEDAEKEMAAKEDGEEPESKDKEEKQQKQEDTKKEEEKDQQGHKEEEEEEDEEDEEHGAQDVDDLYEDKHDVDVRKEEEFELPEDMELEGDDGKDDQEGEENEQDEEKEEQEEQDMESTEQEQMKEGEEEEEEDEEEGEGEGEENRDHDDKEKDGEDELKDEGDKEATASEGTELKNEEEEEEEEEDDEQHDRLQANSDEKYETEAAEQAQGVMDRTGAESSNITLDPEERKRKEEKEEEEDQQRKGGDDQQKQSKENMMDADESVQQGHDNENEEDAESSWKPVSSRQQKRENEESERQNSSKRQAEPNPYRSVGDAMKRWKERLKVLKEQQMNDEQQEERNKEEQEGMDVDEDVEAAEEDIHEFVKKGEEKESDKQTLAPTEETLLEDTQIPLRDQDEVKLQDEKEEETQEQQQKNENKIEEEQEESNTSSALTDQSTKKEKPKDSNEKTKEEEEVEEEEEEMQVEEKKEKEKQEEEDRRQQQTPNEEEDIISASSALEELNLDEEERVDEEKLLLSEEEMARQREDLEAFMSKWRNQENASTMVQAGEELWRRLQKVTDHLSVELCEQLRLILEPTLCTQMRGDYRTGKRLNMKKVIPYIASSFKKDKIWLRRTKPSKRHYQVLLAIDDSRSMKENRCDNFALQALTMMANALAQLEVGELSVLAFGEETKLLHPFGKMWSQESGVEAVSQFSFAQEKTNVLSLLETTVRIFHSSKSAFSAAQPNADNLQLAFFISDGRFGSRGREVKKWIREASLRNIFLVFIITDAPSTSASSSAPSSSEMNSEGKRGEEEEEEGAQKGGRRRRRQQHKEHQLQNLGRPDSILEVQTISYIGGKPTRTSYMDTFPFPNYIIIHDINNLPTVLADALRQWFELLQQKFSQ